MNKTYNIIWNAARGMYIVTSELARSGSRAIVSVSASCAVTLLAMDAAPAVAEETRVSIPSQTTTYTLSGATPFVVETGNTVATDTATSAAIVGDNSNDWDLLIESGAVVGSSLTDSQAMNLDSLTGATSVHNQGTITGSNEDGTIMLQNGGSVINDARIENNATYEHDPQDIPQEYAGVYMLNGGSYVSSESGVLEGVSGVIVQSGEAHITNGGMINSDGSWRSYGVEFRDGTYGTIVNTGTIITTASDGSGKIEDAAIYVHTLNDMAVSGSVSVDNSGLMQSDFITVALYYGSHFEVVNRVGGVITAGNSSLVGIKSTAMELKVGVDNLVTNDGTISAYGTANTYGIHYGESTSGGVITNTGSITTTGGGSGDASVYVHGNGDGTVVNNSGTMSSSVYGVYLDSTRSKGHTLNNQAGGAISANTAVAINGNGNTITNQGKMTGVSDGLLISGNNNIVTTSGGEISGKNGIRVSKGSGNQITAKSGSKITTTSTGISIAGGNNQITTESGSTIVAKDNGILINSGANNVTNGGSITATGSSISYGIQYNSGTSGTITNTGTITTTGKGAGDASVYAHGGAVTINNSGTMDSSVYGVYVTTGHTLNNLAGGSITANTAVQLNGNNNTLANAGAILGDTNGVTINGSGNTLTSQGKITGGTNAILINSGSKNNTLTLNTGTEISGNITDDNNSASANNNLILDGEGTLGSSISGLNSVTSSGDWTLSGATMNLSGTTNSALWVKSGTLILNGAMTAKGATVDSGTTLQIGNSGTLGAFNGDIVDNGTLTFNRSDAAAYGSVISGSGNVIKQGGGELTLSNNNSYSGGTTIAEGTLTATAGGALGSGNIDNRAYLKLDAASASDPFIVADLTTHSGATVEIGAGSTLQANTLTQQDGSTLTADLTATSGPAIRAKNVNLDGTLNVASPASQEPIRSTDDLISLALIESDNAISGDFDDITINGNAMNSDAFITVVGQKNVNDTHYDLVETLTWYADRYNAAIDAHGTFNLADADDSFTVNTVLENVDANSGWNGQSLTKTGAGTLILNAENTYTGGTTISDGTLVANNVEALGTGNVTDNATLELNTGGDFDNAISGSGQVVKSGDDALTLSGTNTYSGGTTISGGTLIASNVEALGTGDVTDNAVLELNTGGDFANNIGGSGQVVKSGDETLTLSGTNSYTGGTTISGGTLVASNVEALGSGDVTDNATLEMNTGGDFANNIGGTGSVVKSGDKTLTLSGSNIYTGGTLISGGTLIATNVDALGTGDVTDNATLEMNTGGDFANAIGGTGSVVKSGDETLTLSGSNIYTGGTTISGGTLVATNVEALGSGDVTDNATLELNTGGTFDNVISGSGQVVKSGDDALTLSGNNSYTGGTLISDGTLVASNVEALGSGDVTDNATLALNTGGDFTNNIGGTGRVEKSGDDALTLSGANSYTGGTLISGGTLVATNVDALGTGNVTDNATLELNTGGDFDNAISGSGQVVKSGDKTLTLSGANSYTGGTTISSGTLIATNVEALGTGDVTDNATLELNTGGDFDNNIGGTGSVVKSGDETLTLSGANSYTGGTTISGGTLVATSVDALGSGDVTDNATLEMNTGGDFANNIGGTGSVVKSGDKTLTLSGSNTYAGGTTINDGTLVANNVEALGTGDVIDNATLELNTGGDFDNAISGSGQVVKSGDKTLTLSGANSYSGATTISGGTLIAANVNALGTGAIDNRASLLLDASGQFTVTDLTTESGGNTEIGAGSTLQATTLTQKSDSTLTINLNSNTADPVIHAASQVSLAGTLDITGVGDVLDSDPASTDDLDTFTLIASDKTIAGDFEKLTVAGMDADLADFITVDGRIDDMGKQYELTTALTWYADRDDAVTDAHGTFNLTNADGSFAVNTVLENVDATLDPASSTGWDGTSLIKQGAGTLILNAENTYTGGTTISGGTLVATNVDALGSGDVTDDATLELNTGGTFDNAISGSGQVVKSGDDALTLSGANTYTGGTTINDGTLVACNVEALGTGDVTDNATLELNTGGTFDNVISGSGQMVKSGDDTLTLSGSNTYTGGTTISGGTLVATSVDALGSGDVTNDAVLELNTGGDFDNAISGSGQVVKSGDETLTLSGANSYTGGTTISGGTLVASNVEALGSSDVTDNATLELNTGGDFTNNISGSGQVVKSGDDVLTLSGANSYSGGTLISDGTLVASNVEALGTGDITDNAVLELNTGGDFDNAISGSGQVVKSGDETLTLSGSNTYTGGTTISGGTLVASNVDALGTGDVTDNATLELNTGGTFDNVISGSGQVVKSGDKTLTLSGANSYTGGTTINDGTLVASNVDALGSGDVTNDAVLELNTGGDFTNNISGSGQVVKSGDETLTLSGTNSYTDGTLISGGTLVATNLEALGTGDVTNNATLELNTGGDFTNNISGSGQVVKSGDETLTLSGANSYTGGTTISGGTLVASNVEALGSGDVTDNATLEMNTGGDFDNAISGSGQVVKSGDKTLTLSGANSYTGGTTISGGTLVASNVEALGSGDIDNYASLQLNASGQFVTANLTTHDNATTAIGAGSALRANTLTQEANSTLAVHLIDSNSGAIVTADHANLGGTLDITGIGNVAKSWTRDAYAYTLIDTDSAINSDFAQFTVAGMDAKQVDFLTVDGRVNAADDTRYDVTASLSWYADSDNAATDAHGTFTLSEQGHSFTLNTALTDVDATLNPDSATYWDGKSLIKRGAGTLILGAQNTYSGDTDVQEGALWLAETATIGSAGSAQAVNIAANAAFGGHNATVNGHVNNQGSLYFVDTFTVNGDVVNSSAMISGSDQPNNTLTIAGNYTGNDGHLYLNTQLGDDSSPTDKLIVTGDTAGSTTLHITNVNGLGAQTVNGIEVIEVGGQSDGDFTLYKGHVDINAWTYTLKQDGGDWYLRSESDDVPDDGGEVTPPDDGGEVTPPDDGGDVTPPDGGGDVTPPDDGGEVTPPDDGGEVTPPDDGGDVTPPDDGGDVTPVAPQYRADIGVYLGNQWMARNLQMQTLYDREGSQYRSADGSIWMRFKAGKAESQAVNGNVDIDSDYSQFQLGGDILTWSDGAQSVTVGLMGSYINANTDSTGNRGADGSQFSANGSVDGYNLGLYATWFADAQSHRGAYIDSWYQYGAYNNSVDNDGLSASRYDSAAHAVSLETGYRYDIALSNRNTVSLTPQAQVTWQRYSADTVIDDGGTRISGQNDDSWTTRLGMRVDGKLYKESGRIQPFMEVNWLHASDNAAATFGDTKVSQDLPNDRVEVKVGIQANVSERLSVYAQAAGQKGKNDYGDASFSLNMRYNW
ncbi:autotransporter outer membrane beta-barrel domain-containing protein [Salmonella enterica]|uniref:Autotransporter outer membrane beta-barrel domain-containing protein n=9 Tax=Salmonella enterica TaxID=28901 RepID=A0A5I8HT85_SALET|nr:autotransporter-associated beta strand repeat-containing protein [Salmonella enterica]EAC2032375.1 autotransporter outer membrane beta-barrel domain-containing protein [Salmonella enterica subsp. enterica]EDV2723899.1 autotransporter outer membrane beta-barrel domain-containing protein [Salmonella enterica subsp. enterica serovar Johannesburg]EEJ2630188.1 autotransporter outer membrane beta-barrel domain-containing protein [Salmonella enterica subsp. enterica serovar Anatum]MCL9128897.1 auto